jgi:hypothetical protein
MDVNALPMASKTCFKCKQLKQKSEFPRDKSRLDGYCGKCKNCHKLYKCQNAGKIAAHNALYRKDRKEQNKEAYEQNKEAIAARGKKRYQENKEAIAARGKEKYQQDRCTMRRVVSDLLRHARARARRNNLPFDLTREWLETMMVSHCPITLQPIDWLKEQVVDGKVGPNSPSIDKIIPELGYVQSNCAIISHRGNLIKSNGSIDEHRRVVQYMAAQQLRDIEF